jgi:hypothetical protein
MIFVSGLHIVIVVIFSFELLELGERIHTLGVGNQLLDPVVAVKLGDNPEISLRGVMQTVDVQLLPFH